ncbi:unnamed protein product [Eruca vesicaria subsp. sativa]|uniref:Uncharacterized protein n=1 Tax=Eruca vesicaria subsp. sativa TaxID=29727 RepID=A0ABC8KWW0_ERUVS|nr:unnamed protein product [Eruca vesicaria subsp. sativa]
MDSSAASSSYSFASSPARKKPDSSFDYDAMFKEPSMPVYDKPVFDEDVFDDEPIPHLHTSQSDRFDNVFASMESPSRLRNQNSSGSSVFDDLIPEFGRPTSPPTKRSTSERKPPSSNLVDLDESASTTLRQPPTGGFTDPFEEFNSKQNVDSSDSLHSLGRSGSDMDSRGKSHLRPPNLSASQSPVYSSGSSYHGNKVAFDHVLESHYTSSTTVPPQPTSPVYENKSLSSDDDVWLTVSEIPLFTQPTSAHPPSRPPPPRPTTRKVNEPSLSSSTNPIASLNDFSMGRSQAAANGYPDPPSDEQDSDVFSTAVASAAAMKDAMDKAEAKFRHAKERKERDHLKANRVREGDPMESRENGVRENQARLDRERAEMEREAEQKRVEKERERLLARQAVERATREARQRAAAEAQAKAQRAAVAKATTDARERAERAAVQRAHLEARERAAAGAKEKAERAAAEARERANAEEREKEAKLRAERAAAAQAQAKQQESNDDLDSFFNSVSRPSSAPRQRTNPPNPFQDSWNRGGSFESSKASENLRKTSSVTNIVDDLSSIFGASATQSGGFQDIAGETEDKRRARLERHQKIQERAEKALAEKNNRDLQVQREQAERNRIGVTLDVEIKRWGAGKEGNLRALLSTLQYVLWPECGWQPVALTDLITAASVKKFYRKATLCIHPDKVQQKGANLQQKYIAEKVFDMLKEAWNKFNSEELF